VSTELIREALAPHPERLRIATKVGNGGPTTARRFLRWLGAGT
jgi:hypothetical protein